MRKIERILFLGLIFVLCAGALAACQKAHVHNYKGVVTRPTCTEKGYTTYTCECSHSYVADYVNTIAHSFGQYVSNHDGTKIATCACGTKNAVADEAVLIVQNGVVNGLTEYGKTLTKIVLPEGITGIGDAAFANNTIIESIEIPNSVTSIGNRPFENCTALSCYEKDGLKYLGNPQNNYLYLVGTGIDGKGTTLTTVTIDSNCKFIGSAAFKRWFLLEDVIIPEGVTAIGDYAFAYCYELKRASIPSSVTSIGRFGFFYCGELQSVIIPLDVATVGEQAFHACDMLTIRCEAAEEPEQWHFFWNALNRPVIWGYIAPALPEYQPGSIQLEDQAQDDYDFQRKYRLAYYRIWGEYMDLLTDEERADMGTWTEQDGEQTNHGELRNEMMLVSFIKRYNITREEFDNATAQLEDHLKGSSHMEECEIPNGDIIYTLDNEIINHYYRYA